MNNPEIEGDDFAAFRDILPEAPVYPETGLRVVGWIDENGNRRWEYEIHGEQSMTSIIGFLESVKIRFFVDNLLPDDIAREDENPDAGQ